MLPICFRNCYFRNSLKYYNQVQNPSFRSYYSYSNSEKIKLISQELKKIKLDINKLYEKDDYKRIETIKPELKDIKDKISNLRKMIKPNDDIMSRYHHIE
jgi:peptidoglycan hydrolase CwlO-like protein